MSTTTSGTGAQTSSIPGWIQDLLFGLGSPLTTNNVQKLEAWNACEGNAAGQSGLPINNPFNTTLAGYGGVSVNSAGVKDYPSWQNGATATVYTIRLPAYAAILSNLRSDGTQSDFASAVGGSGWGTNGGCIASSMGQPYTGGSPAGGDGIGPQGLQGAPTGGQGGVGCHAKDNGSNCAINFPGSFCITYCELKALRGGVLVLAGGSLLVTGLLVLVAGGFARTGAGKAATQALQVVPGGSAVKALGARTQASRASSRRLSEARRREEIKTEGAITRNESRSSTSSYRRATRRGNAYDPNLEPL